MDMKTAMQQMLMFINSFDEEPINPIFLRLMAEQLIEKEKEQIIEAHFEGWSDAYDYLSEFNNDKARQAEEYYEETYEKE